MQLSPFLEESGRWAFLPAPSMPDSGVEYGSGASVSIITASGFATILWDL